MKIVTIEVIPDKEQRYDTCGDWQFNGDQLAIRVSELGDWRYEMLVAVHELVEALACRWRNITQEQVDQFDLNWIETSHCSEPGDDPAAPYYHQHQLASGIERVLAAELNINWSEYERTIEAL